MDIDVRIADDVVILDCSGRLAAGVSDDVLNGAVNGVLAEEYKKILLNLSEVDYIDSNGLGELVQSYKASQRSGASIRLLQPQDRVRKSLTLTKLLPLFQVHDSEEEALESFAKSDS